jgi:hypothetical protein
MQGVQAIPKCRWGVDVQHHDGDFFQKKLKHQKTKNKNRRGSRRVYELQNATILFSLPL